MDEIPGTSSTFRNGRPILRITEDGLMTQGLFGLKAGMRRNRVGVFGRLMPGFLHISKGNPTIGVCAAIGCPQIEFRNRTDFATAFGGVLEFYPSRRALVRFDVSDTFIRRSVFNQRVNTHNLQLGTSVGFRF